ncbi:MULTISPECIES: hypothetical protein [unclassified Streptomyces]|uniref:hypothetical protein n=1 Tax=unclassified Streptomyces TaxID=2593676 RepID=UPI003324C62D
MTPSPTEACVDARRRGVTVYLENDVAVGWPVPARAGRDRSFQVTACVRAAAAHGALFLNTGAPLTATARQPTGDPAALWSDGVHLTELGDTILLQQTEQLLAEHRTAESSRTTRSWSATPP